MAYKIDAKAALRSLIVPIYLPMVFLSTGMAAPVPGFPQYLSGLGAAVATVGFVISLRGVGRLVSDIPGGIIIERFGVRRIVLLSFATAAASSVVIAATVSLVVIAVAKTVMGFSTAVITLGMMTYVRKTVSAIHRGRALSLAGGSLRVGLLVGPLVGGLLAEAAGVPSAFLFQAAVTAVGFVLTAVGMRPVSSPPGEAARGKRAARPTAGDSPTGVPSDLPRSSPNGSPNGSAAVSAGTIARLREGLRGQWTKLATVGFAIFTLMLLRASRQIIMPLWGDSLGMTPAVIGQIMSASAAVELFIVLPAGFIMDKGGRKVAASLCMGIFAVGVTLLPLSAGTLGFLLLGLVIGIGNGFGSGINMTIGTDLAPEQAIGEFLGLWRLFGDVGAALGPVIVGAIAGALTLPLALLVTGGIGILGTLVMAVIAPETRERGPTPNAGA